VYMYNKTVVLSSALFGRIYLFASKRTSRCFQERHCI